MRREAPGADEGADNSKKGAAAVGTEAVTVVDLSDAKAAEMIEAKNEDITDVGKTEVSAEANGTDDLVDYDDSEDVAPAEGGRRVNWSRALAYGALPGLTLLLAATAGFLKWQDSVARDSAAAGIESVAAAKEATIALLSYEPGSAEKTLGAAKDRLTGTFKESYTQLTNDVVIPAAKQKHISIVAKVPAAASVSATPNHAVALVLVNQTAVMASERPTDTASSVRVILDKIDGRWLISSFDPI